jgi:hypothetical protein
MYNRLSGLLINVGETISSQYIVISSGQVFDTIGNVIYNITPATINKTLGTNNYIYLNVPNKQYVVSTSEISNYNPGIYIGKVNVDIAGNTINIEQNPYNQTSFIAPLDQVLVDLRSNVQILKEYTEEVSIVGDTITVSKIIDSVSEIYIHDVGVLLENQIVSIKGNTIKLLSNELDGKLADVSYINRVDTQISAETLKEYNENVVVNGTQIKVSNPIDSVIHLYTDSVGMLSDTNIYSVNGNTITLTSNTLDGKTVEVSYMSPIKYTN